MVLFVGVEAVEGFESESEAGGCWAAVVVIEEERVGAGVEGEGECAQDVEGGLAGAGFVPADLGDVDGGPVGEHLLGDPGCLALSGQACGEVGVGHTGSLPEACIGVVVSTIDASFRNSSHEIAK